MIIKPVIVCIAKLEKDYIIEFVRYHISLGFYKIFIFDNEDIPIYADILKDYIKYIIVIHIPGKYKQYTALHHYTKYYMKKDKITHSICLDVDEFIVLKKHKDIKDFIQEYIKCSNNSIFTGGIGINWVFFGDNGLKEKTDIPNTIRFTRSQTGANHHIKTLFNVKLFSNYNTMHDITIKNPYYPIRNTKKDIIIGPFNENIDTSIIQINHYKVKTKLEFFNIRKRGRADIPEEKPEDIEDNFNLYNYNDIEDYTAYNFYSNIIKNDL